MSARDPHIAVRGETHWTHDASGWRERTDRIAVEEPLEIRLQTEGRDGFASVAVTMRTPGDDGELAAGFLVSEGILRDRAEVVAVKPCPSFKGPEANTVRVIAREGVEERFDAASRNFYATSSCGVCGKASIEKVRMGGFDRIRSDLEADPRLIASLPERFLKAQSAFEATGGLHAAGLFDARGELTLLREDVGRHNAVDKVVGERFLDRALPLSNAILMVSGRIGFEIAQKALVAGIPMLCAVGAPSSLAVDLAREFGMTLVGFLRQGRFNVYAHERRVAL